MVLMSVSMLAMESASVLVAGSGLASVSEQVLALESAKASGLVAALGTA